MTQLTCDPWPNASLREILEPLGKRGDGTHTANQDQLPPKPEIPKKTGKRGGLLD